ncbi:GNAT family N-acetyltransferase [Pseudanabaena sp. FACHB-1998]|uniref:GNAT family N-acetyltransferase n=1 Tax=Pseudanabaena sp. FACHB-1998 TaxID=2692858 RepID=UPI001681BD91|nr:GNAT family N-acetyltransferase [Pseudanabaena sp. FACHB-1998]MBD2179364.1 GNAT family N-acetyltransferase [Pseudanabaena sp. FACHB-1998]
MKKITIGDRYYINGFALIGKMGLPSYYCQTTNKFKDSMQIQALSRSTLSSAIELANLVFPYQKVLERADLAFKLSLTSGWTSKLILQLVSIAEPRYWVALNEDGDVTGVTGLYKYLKDKDDSLWLGWTCVSPLARGKGIGGQLVDFAITKARSEGKKFLKLYTSNHPNESAAQHLYERRGLQIVGEGELQGSSFKRIYRQLDLTNENNYLS